MLILTLIVVFAVVAFFACALCKAASQNVQSVVETENVYDVVARQAEESRVAHYLRQKTLGMMVSERLQTKEVEIAGKHWFRYDFKKITFGDWLNICRSVLVAECDYLGEQWDEMMLEPSSLDSYWGAKSNELWELIHIVCCSDRIKDYAGDAVSAEDIRESCKAICRAVFDVTSNLDSSYRIYFGRFWDDSKLRFQWAGGKTYPVTKLNG